MAEAMETEMELSDGEQSNANTHIAVSQYSAPPPPVYNRNGLIAAYGNASIGLEKGMMERRHDHEQQLPGYVFMCNARTKTDCFRYRVFGIPSGRMEIVERIKPGMKLFLYDFEKRLLYGVYEATIGGKLDIEPEAFDRMYPAQVGFRIFRNCYPLPENTFKSAIFENYKGAKFKQELTPHQVMSLLSLFRPFSAPELDSLSHRLSSRASAPRTLSFEERFIAATQLRNASSVFDPLSGRHAEPKLGSLMAHQSAVPRTSLLQHSYSRQEDYTNPVREALSLSNLNLQPYHPTEPRQQRLLGDPSRSSIQDPQLKYLTILSNIRRYGTAPERSASENEYHPATPSEKEQFSSPHAESKYYPSTLSGNEHSFAASAPNGSVYRSEFYNTSASQKEGEASKQQHEIPGGSYYHPETSTVPNIIMAMQHAASKQHEIPGGSYYHPEASTVPNTTMAMQQAVSVSQSYTETAPAHGAAPQQTSAAGAIGYTHQPQSVAGNNYTTHSQPGSVEEITQSYAGTSSYTQEQYYAAMGHTAQLYAGGTGYAQQPHEVGYAQQPHAAATLYTQQPHGTATAYAQQPHGAATAYAQQSHAAATAYAQQPYAAANGYAQAGGYMPQYHAQAAGYAQQAVAQGSTTGTTDWLAASQAYSAARDWNAVNQSYYPHTADAKTSYNPTS